MSLEQSINNDLKQALKDKETVKVSTLRMLRGALHNLAIEKKTDNLDDQTVFLVIRRELKKRHDSIESYKSAGRDDLVEVEEDEAKILEEYLPDMMTEEELGKIVDEVIAAGSDNFGQVMKEVMAKTEGRADGKMVQMLVKAKLKT